MWFQSKQKTQTPLPSNPVQYPSGVCVVTDKGRYLINKDGKRYRIATERVFESWNFPIVVNTSEAALKNFPVAVTRLGFRDGTLLNNMADGKLYLVSAGKARHVTGPDILASLGLKPVDAWYVSQAELNLMKIGEDIH